MRANVAYAYDIAMGNATRVYRDELSMEVREVATADVVPAFRTRGFAAVNAPGRPAARFPAKVAGPEGADVGEVLVVGFEGSLYEPVRIFRETYGEAPTCRLAGAQDLHDAGFLFPDLPEVVKLHDYEQGGKKPGPASSRAAQGARETARARDSIAEHADDLLLVDGVVHRKVREPVLTVQEGCLWVVPLPSYVGNEKGHVFRLDEVEDAVAEAASVLGEEGAARARGVAALVGLEDGFVPSADFAVAALVRAYDTLEREGGRELPRLPLPAMSAFVDMREAAGSRYEIGREGRADAVADAMAAFVESVSGYLSEGTHPGFAADVASTGRQLALYRRRSSTAPVAEDDLDAVAP